MSEHENYLRAINAELEDRVMSAEEVATMKQAMREPFVALLEADAMPLPVRIKQSENDQ